LIYTLIPFELPYPTIYVRRGGLWAKHMGLKQGAIGNTNGNTGNPLGTRREQRKVKKFLPLNPNSKEKRTMRFE